MQQRQDVLNEWHRRCVAGYVKNAIAYLYGLIKKAVAGQFRLWAARKPVGAQQTSADAVVVSPEPRYREPKPAPQPVTAQVVRKAGTPVSREEAQAYLAQLKGMFDKPRSANQVLGELEHTGLLSGPHGDGGGMDYGPLGAV